MLLVIRRYHSRFTQLIFGLPKVFTLYTCFCELELYIPLLFECSITNRPVKLYKI